MEVTINYNGQAVAVEVTLEVYDFLTRPIIKRRICSMNSGGITRGIAGSLTSTSLPPRCRGLRRNRRREYLCRMERCMS